MMKTTHIGISLAFALSLVLGIGTLKGQTQPLLTAQTTSDSPKLIADLHRDWILTGWEYKASDGPFIFRQKLGRYYDFSAKDLILYDDFDPQHRIVRKAAAYAAIWEPSFATLQMAHHGISFGPYATLSGTIASSTLQFVARLAKKDGTVTGIRTFSSLVWQRGASGWKIIREHNSSVIIPSAEIDAALSQATK